MVCLGLLRLSRFSSLLFKREKINELEKRNNPIQAARRSERLPASGRQATPQMMTLRRQG